MSGMEHQRQFSDWLDRHKGLIFKVVRAYAFTTQDREDLFQDVAAQIWRSIPRFQGQAWSGCRPIPRPPTIASNGSTSASAG
jgi:RNA polymerase sigma-70 factor (ECF subfamily)